MAKRTKRIFMKVTPEEVSRISEKMREVGIQNRSAYLRKMALDGYCINMDFTDVKELVSLLRRCSNNLNQYAKRANTDGSIYARDISDLQYRLDKIWDLSKEIMSRLSTIR